MTSALGCVARGIAHHTSSEAPSAPTRPAYTASNVRARKRPSVVTRSDGLRVALGLRPDAPAVEERAAFSASAIDRSSRSAAPSSTRTASDVAERRVTTRSPAAVVVSACGS